MFGFGKRNQEQLTTPAQQDDKPRRKFTGLGRHLARMFDAGQSDRLTESWGTMPLTADDIVRRNQRVIVARSREQAANNDYAKAYLRMCRQNIVGQRGVQLQAQSRDPSGKLDQLANDAIEAAWHAWGKRQNCDVTGQLSWRSLQSICTTSAAKDGEFMVRIITGSDAGEWGVALQVLDPQRCPVDFDQEKLPSGKFVRHGIEFNRYGKPLAYYFTTTDAVDADYSYGGRHYVRVPAKQIIHGFLPDIVGQKRGLPWMATGLWRAKMLEGFEKAALVNARVSAAKGGFFEWEEGYGPEQDEDEELYMDADPGSFQELPAGVRFREWNPQYPSGEFAPFHKSMLRGFASGWGVAYNNLANDLEGVNFSSIRQGKLDERDNWKDLQEWLIEQLIEPVFEAWLPRQLLAGRIKVNGKPLKAERLDKYRNVSWQPRRWEWIDPRADMDAAERSVQNLIDSPSQVIRNQGRDPQTVWRELARDIEAMKAAGIPDEFISTAMGIKMGGAGNGPASTEQNAGD
ncbi:phage portal protein [Marinobacterium sp. AK62]|uniref:Phage portal protein n=1 Tax=Marinobacterium alkalitolerans TaxID=1542925 RepID=A0ABS3Z7J5_9GAMM|nr:phage portal protein [Marinobacterium alkalitolerans]MBP0047658.1 phage portal protein [Marinobacterium alkalitolerans]